MKVYVVPKYDLEIDGKIDFEAACELPYALILEMPNNCTMQDVLDEISAKTGFCVLGLRNFMLIDENESM